MWFWIKVACYMLSIYTLCGALYCYYTDFNGSLTQAMETTEVFIVAFLFSFFSLIPILGKRAERKAEEDAKK